MSAASASASAKPFPSHVKTIWAKPLIFGTKNIWVWRNVLYDLIMTLTQSHGCGVHYHQFACLCDKVRTTHRITSKRYILKNFLKNFRMCFFKVKHYFGHNSGMVGPIDVKWKWSALVGYWVQYVTLTFDLTHDLDLGCFKVKFRNSSISGIVGLIDMKWKGSELIWYWADCMTLPFDHTHDLDIGGSRSESEIALSEEWGGRLTMNEKDASHPFMTMILTCVTMLGWADVPDNDRGDFRRRCAVNISSLYIILWVNEIKIDRFTNRMRMMRGSPVTISSGFKVEFCIEK